MTDAQALQYLLTAAAQKPYARIVTMVDRLRVAAKLEELNRYRAIEDQAKRLMQMAGCSEGIC